ncbi:polycystic kidney disease protein 1-like 2 [Cyclopterus lumpus]|uniref:polycystic kidney disease protein 1-like 2 n=1 Tax=Cyclopterus lumpus TaxID=8103 RepID=UPI001485DC52|nr:polycystic kidney disease protein 1-like 2 [Cyclopterus lumpus]
MCWTFVHLLTLTTLSCLSEAKVPVGCPDYQRAFGGSCYEFVDLQHSFVSAQAWCEQRGGHLAFIPDEETQYFLQGLSDPEKDVWLGLAPHTDPNLQYSATLKGALSWLDGSPVTYSNWVSRPPPGAACGHAQRQSGFQWEATRDCNQKLHFICQFDAGRSIVCAGRNPSLQCGSGQVLMIDGGFYGRENIHYCRSALSPPATSAGHRCGWVDVVESLTAHCHGRQVCQIAEVVDSLVEPCPQRGSYLSVDHHCKDGLTLSVSTVAAVLDNVAISVEWLLRAPQGKPSCKLSTGDGRVIHLHSPEGLESSEVHKYTRPGTFVVAVECTSSGVHVTARSAVDIQEPVTVFGAVRCFAGRRSFHANGCKTLRRETFLLQMVVKAGSHVTYRIQSGDTLLLRSSVFRGNVPQNVTVTPEMTEHFGPGCHRLTLYASNMVTYHEVCTHLQMCVLEKIGGLQASVLTDGGDYLRSPGLTVGVSLERGAPVLLLFSLTGDNSSHHETREMNTSKDVFRIANPIQVGVVPLYKKFTIDASKPKKEKENSDTSNSKSPGTSDTTTTPTSKSSGTSDTTGNSKSPGTSDTTRNSKSPGTSDTTRNSKSPGTSDTTPTSKSPGTSDTTPTSKSPGTSDTTRNSKSPGTSDTTRNSKSPGTSDTTRNSKSPGTSDTTPTSKSPGTSDTTRNSKSPGTSDTTRNSKSPGTSDTTPTSKSPGTSDTTPTSKSPGTSDTTRNSKSPGTSDTTRNSKSPGTSDTTPTSKSPGTSDTTPTSKSPGTSDTTRNSKSPGTSDTTRNSKSPGTSDTTPTSKSPGTSDTTTTPTSKSPGTSDTTTTPTSKSPGTSDTTPTSKSPGTSDTTTTPTSKSPGTSDTTTTPTSKSPGTSDTTPTSKSPGSSDTTPTSKSPGTSDTTPTAKTSAASPPSTRNNVGGLECSISPRSGTTIDIFTLTCKTEPPCTNCQYCFKTDEGGRLRCSNNDEVKSVFLPLGDGSSNYDLIITATAQNGSFVSSATITATVLDFTATSDSSVKDVKASVENTVAQLKKQSLLSAETVGQLVSSVSDKLNAQSEESSRAARQKLRERLLDIMIDAVKEAPSSTPEEVRVIARGLAAVVQKGTELSSSAQEEASLLFVDLSSHLLLMDVNKSEDNMNVVHAAASSIVEGASAILDYSSNKLVSDALLLSLSNTQSALLAYNNADKAPIIIQQAHVSVFVNSFTFSLPTLPSDILPSEEPVDIRMLSLGKNPFSWNERGNISGPIGALSLSRTDGSSIPVENLSEDIKILMPRPVGEQVNTSFLDLGNYSTTAINVPSGNTTLVLKMAPSKEPLPFKLFLGHMDYPTETNHVAMTEMPHQGATQEERYTWLLDPEDLKGNNGVHYLVVRPIVGPGIKSINATLSITSFAAACKFWDESALEWSTFGCRVGVHTTHSVTQCLCNHLTFFGGSFFVTPNLVDASRTAELFGTFTENPVVVCFVGSLFVAYLLVVVWARRKDIHDTAKVKVTVLEDNDPLDEHRYLLSVSTGHRRGASTSSQVTITLLGAEGTSEPHHLEDPKKCVFERGAVDVFLLTAPFSLGDLQGIRLWHNNSGGHPAWYVGNVVVHDVQTGQKWHFLCNSWLAIDIGDGSLDKVVPVSTEMDLKRFSNLFFMKTAKDFSDGHLWYSVISRPPSSSFTCVQRVSCCFALLLCTMLTSIMFYGIPTDPSEQTMDLGHFEFTWQQFMVGVQSSLIMFPINILIVSIFRNARPRETSCCKRKAKKTDENSSSQATSARNVNVTVDTVVKTMKSNAPCTECEFGPGQQVDINAVLSTVEDFIKLNNKTIDAAQPRTPPEGSPGSTVEGIQKKSNKSQHLYQQLCHIDKELSLLGPSGFPSPHSYSRALQQIQGIKGFLEDQLFTVSCVKPDELTQKKGCCHGGLPWWFVFVGWLLVIGCSFVAGYYTMLYGLKFGKQRSVSWLVSMIISFFQSVLVLQPLKMLCLAVFFALVIKKVEEDDFQNMEFERNLGDRKEQHAVTRDQSLYEPPPAADVEEMRRKQIVEQKAFALLKEILTYMGFMWMLLLVAYGQRDPNAFLLNRHIRDSFVNKTSGSMSLRDVFTWANTSLLSNLFGDRAGYITDGNSKLVGNARLRQLRVLRDSCQIAGPMLQFAPDCNAPYSWEVEDMGSYDTGWNRSERDNTSTSPWTYQTQSQLRAYPIWGKMVLYRGGGYVAELGPDLQNASSTLEYLFRNTWLDVYTRAVFAELTVYNANVNLFCIVTLLLETTAVGAFQFHSELRSVRLYQSTGGLHIFVMAAEIMYLLFILYYMFLQGKLMQQQRWSYFRSKWNLLMLTIILLSWSAVAVFVKRTLLGNRDMTYYQNHKDQFASFYETATADSVLQYLIAFLVLLATFQMWHLLRLNPKMNMITAALLRAWNDISTFLVVIVILLVAYSVASNVIYGWKMSSYRTLMDALLTVISMQIGIFNYDEVLDNNPVLGGLLFGSCVVLMTFVVLNLFLSVILVAFHEEQIHHKPSDEEEIVDLMLKNICSFFGIRYKDTKDTRGPDVNEDAGLALNRSRNPPNDT